MILLQPPRDSIPFKNCLKRRSFCSWGADTATQRNFPRWLGACLAKQAPSHLGKFLCVAVSAPQEQNERLFRQFLNGMLSRGGCNNIMLTGAFDQRRARYPVLP